MFITCILIVLLFTQPGYSQCSAPTNVATTVTNITCPSNGAITVGALTGGAGDAPQFALYDATNTTLVRPYQIATVFNDLAAGTYSLRTQYICGTGFSPVFTKTVTVGGTYTQPNISNITVQRAAQCNNGRISVTATGGTLPRTFALVSSLNAPIGSSLTTPQSASVFDSLAAGTYYVRVYDACGSFATSSVTVAGFTQVNPFNGLFISYLLCDSLYAQVSTLNLNSFVTGTTDTLRRLWISYPDGSTDTLPTPTGGNDYAFYSTFGISLFKLGTVGPGHFPDNIGGTWPKTLVLGLKDPCGNVFLKTITYAKPNTDVAFTQISGGNCDSSVFVFQMQGANVYMNANASFSLDSGATWNPVTTIISPNSQNIKLPVGNPYHVCFAHCGDTTYFNGVVAGPPPFSILTTFAEYNSYSCSGNTGLILSFTNAVNPVAFEMISGPSGQVWSSDTVTGSTYNYNLIPGSYVLKFTDACGRIITTTVNATHPFQPIDFDFGFPCSSTNLVLTFPNGINQYVNAAYSSLLGSPWFSAGIYNADSTTPALPNSYTNNGASITIPGSVISPLPDGNYVIKVWKSLFSGDTCTSVYRVWNKTSSVISLNNSLAIAGCSGSVGSGTVVAVAQGGGGYSYSLYKNLVMPDSLVAGPQPSNIFNGLNAATTYIVTVSDTCGRGTQATMSFGTSPLAVYNNTGGIMPCPGSSLTLSVNNVPGLAYQWFKNNVAISGDTLNALTITSISTSDSGQYKIGITAGTCNIFESSFALDPAQCGTPLGIALSSFSAKIDGNTTLLNWETFSEQNNKGFGVERSIDGKTWDDLVFVNSLAKNGNATQELKYVYTDKQPSGGINFYRLRQVDLDGKSAYSNIQQVDFYNKRDISVSPSPTKGEVNIAGLKGNETIYVANMVGQRLLTMVATNKTQLLDISGFASGAYIVNIVDGSGNTLAYKIVKE